MEAFSRCKHELFFKPDLVRLEASLQGFRSSMNGDPGVEGGSMNHPTADG